MADDFLGCPNTGGKEPCNPECLLFVRNHSDLRGRRMENYCKKYGRVDRAMRQNNQVIEEKGGVTW